MVWSQYSPIFAETPHYSISINTGSNIFESLNKTHVFFQRKCTSATNSIEEQKNLLLQHLQDKRVEWQLNKNVYTLVFRRIHIRSKSASVFMVVFLDCQCSWIINNSFSSTTTTKTIHKGKRNRATKGKWVRERKHCCKGNERGRKEVSLKCHRTLRAPPRMRTECWIRKTRGRGSRAENEEINGYWNQLKSVQLLSTYILLMLSCSRCRHCSWLRNTNEWLNGPMGRWMSRRRSWRWARVMENI